MPRNWPEKPLYVRVVYPVHDDDGLICRIESNVSLQRDGSPYDMKVYQGPRYRGRIKDEEFRSDVGNHFTIDLYADDGEAHAGHAEFTITIEDVAKGYSYVEF